MRASTLRPSQVGCWIRTGPSSPRDLSAEYSSARRHRYANKTKDPIRGPGRPNLAVVARELTLLPRHWDGL